MELEPRHFRAWGVSSQIGLDLGDDEPLLFVGAPHLVKLVLSLHEETDDGATAARELAGRPKLLADRDHLEILGSQALVSVDAPTEGKVLPHKIWKKNPEDYEEGDIFFFANNIMYDIIYISDLK